MSRPAVLRAVVTLLVVVSLAACAKKDDQTSAVQPNVVVPQNQANLQPLIDAIAPDKDSVYVNFSCGTVNSIGLADAKTNGKSAWAVRRHPSNPITWAVAQNVTIDSLKGKSTPLPIIVDPNENGGAPGKSFKATVDSNYSGPPSTTYDYLIGLTCKVGNKTTKLLIDPEFIVNKP